MDQSKELASLLRELLTSVEDEISNRDGVDRFDIGCGNCAAGLPMAHSLGCRIQNALLKAGV